MKGKADNFNNFIIDDCLLGTLQTCNDDLNIYNQDNKALN